MRLFGRLCSGSPPFRHGADMGFGAIVRACRARPCALSRVRVQRWSDLGTIRRVCCAMRGAGAFAVQCAVLTVSCRRSGSDRPTLSSRTPGAGPSKPGSSRLRTRVISDLCARTRKASVLTHAVWYYQRAPDHGAEEVAGSDLSFCLCAQSAMPGSDGGRAAITCC
eukprot:1162343-Rhodomonas_salina.2